VTLAPFVPSNMDKSDGKLHCNLLMIRKNVWCW
jgi:hypothetical protein